MARRGGKGVGVFAPPEKRNVSIIPFDMGNLTSRAILTKEKEYENLMKTYEFERRTDKTIVMKKIQDFVERGMAAYEEDINIRRLKLRDMIQEEEAELTREVVDQLHRKTNSKAEEMKLCAEMERTNEEENRRVTVMLKRQQQYFENSPEVRDKISREMARGVKYANLAQILEKDDRIHEEKRLNGLWHEIMLREIEAQRQHDEMEKRKRLERGKATGAILMEQMANSSVSIDEMRQLRNEECEKLEKLWAQVRMEETNKLECERMKRMKLKEDLEEQLRLTNRRIEEEIHHEAAQEHKFMMSNKVKLEEEKANISRNSTHLRKEMMAYMKSLEELRREETIRNAQVEAIVDQSVRDATMRRNLAVKRHNENRKRLQDDVMAAREIQLREKQEMQKQERQRFDKEEDLYRNEMKREAAASAAQTCKRREMALHYGKELKAQCDLSKMKKCREAQMVAGSQEHEHDPKYVDQCKKVIEEFLNTPEIITPCAFKIMQKECAARREAEQKVFVDCTRI